MQGQVLGADHPAWDLEADYLAQALHTLICTFSPQRIIMGGGVMDVPGLLPKVREKTVKSLNGYVQHPSITAQIDDYIVPPALGNKAGVLGGIALGLQALDWRAGSVDAGHDVETIQSITYSTAGQLSVYVL